MTAYTYVASGTVASNANGASLSPGAPAGASNGNLLLAFTGQRTIGATVATPTGWTVLASADATSNGLKILGRIKDGTGDDTPAFDWSGSTGSFAWIEAYSGDIYAGDLRTLVTNFRQVLVASQAAPALPVMGVSGTDRLVILFSQKNKTTASDDATTITAPGSYTKRTQVITTGAASGICAASATLQQTSAVDFDGTDFTINGTAEAVTTTGIAIAIRTNLDTPPTIIVDNATEHVRTDTASPQTFSHVGAASGVKAALLAILHGTSNTDHLGANVPTYGGVPLPRIQRNTDGTTEAGAVEWYFVGSGVPQGTNDFSYTPGATTDDIHAVGITLLGTADMEIADHDGVDNNAANPSVTLTVDGREAMAFAALYSGLPNLTDVVENEDCIRIHDHDYGNFTDFVFRQIISSTADFAIGVTSSTDDVAYSAMSVRHVSTGIGMARLPGGVSSVQARQE